MRVLLVEDNVFDLKLQRAALRELGFQNVVIARDGGEAYSTLERWPIYDLIISDWNMPRFDGLALFKSARERWPKVPFMMLTSNDSMEHVKEAMDAGVDAYLVKPFSLDSMRENILQTFEVQAAGGRKKRTGKERRRGTRIPTLDELIKNLDTDETAPALLELNTFLRAIDQFFSRPPGRDDTGGNEKAAEMLQQSAEALKAQGQEFGHAAVPVLVDQLTGFIATIDEPDVFQSEVIKLHGESIHAILVGRDTLATEEDREILFNGLRSAIERTSG